MEETSLFGLVDYIVLAVVMIISSSIGLYYRCTGGQQKTSKEYLLADGNMSVLPVAFSLMASFMSAITLLGVTQENYTYGTQFVLINLAYVISTPVAAYIFLPVFYKLKSPSVYKYLEDRFGRVARTVASIAFSLQMVLYMGIVLYAPALALSAVTGLSFNGSVLGVGLVCTFYSVLGGMKAVLMTDLFQSMLMYATVLAVIVNTALHGSLQQVWDTAVAGGRVQFLEVSPDPTVRHTVWTQVFGGCFVYCSLYAVNQAQVQRLLTLPTLRKAQAALWIQVPILMALSLSTSFAGLCIYYSYRDCDPLAQGRIRKSDQLLPLYIIDHLSQVPGLAGLAVSGIFSGSLSTVSSAINSLAAVTLEDYIKPSCCKLPENRSALVLKVLALGYGLACIGLAFLADLLGTGVLQASLTIFGVVGGPLLGLFTLGMLTCGTEQVGAVTGLMAGLATVAWIGFGGPKPPPLKLPTSTANCTALSTMQMTKFVPLSTPSTTEMNQLESSMKLTDISLQPDGSEYFYLYRISYAWYSFIGFTVTILVGLIVSAIYRKITNQPETVEDKLLAGLRRGRRRGSSRRTSSSSSRSRSPRKLDIAECTRV